MRIYLASKFSRRTELMRYAEQLRVQGHTITSRWLTPYEYANRRRGWAFLAMADLLDLERADMAVFFTTEARTRGGLHVEFGYALAQKKEVLVVGPRPTIFHSLPQATVFRTWPPAYAYLKTRL